MNHKKLQLLVPQYKEDESVISFLLDSVEFQSGIDKKDIGVIICSDGGFVKLSDKFLKKYSYDIEYVVLEHRGVSATRNSAMILSDADYIMFCDADDGFCSNYAIKLIFHNLYDIKHETRVDLFHGTIYNEQQDPAHPETWGFGKVGTNWTFVHGKVYSREFLMEKKIYWNEELKVNEDSYFNCIVQQFAKNVLTIDFPYYVWRYNQSSVSRQEDFMLTSLPSLLISNDGVVNVMKMVGKTDEQRAYTVYDVLCKAYLIMNNKKWYDEKYKDCVQAVYDKLYWFIEKNGKVLTAIGNDKRLEVMNNNRKDKVYCNYLEFMSFEQFINTVYEKRTK